MLPSATTPHPKISTGLWHRMRYGLGAEERTSVIVMLRSDVQPRIMKRLTARDVPRDEKIEIQQNVTKGAQEGVAEVVKRRLDAKSRSRNLPRGKGGRELTRSWLVNALVTVADTKLVGELAGRDDVEAIVENLEVKGPEPVRTAGEQLVEPSEGLTWALQQLQIPELWREGYRGDGVRIGHLDTGVDPTHHDLIGKVVAWGAFDQFGNQLPGTPIFDSGAHGTHTAGTLVGGDASGIAIGVAPDARLVSAQAIPYGRGTLAQVILGIEWAVKERVQVLNLSLGGVGYDIAYEMVVPRLIQNDVFPVISIGNEGFGVTGSPGNIRQACGVGASTMDDEVANFSGGGSFNWYDERGKAVHFIKPDLCAPGVSILSSIPRAYGRSYEYLDGTSMAAPHVCGVVALLRQARPDLPAKKIKEALDKTCHHPFARRRGAHDNRFGRGIIRPVEALRMALSM